MVNRKSYTVLKIIRFEGERGWTPLFSSTSPHFKHGTFRERKVFMFEKNVNIELYCCKEFPQDHWLQSYKQWRLMPSSILYLDFSGTVSVGGVKDLIRSFHVGVVWDVSWVEYQIKCSVLAWWLHILIKCHHKPKFSLLELAPVVCWSERACAVAGESFAAISPEKYLSGKNWQSLPIVHCPLSLPPLYQQT